VEAVSRRRKVIILLSCCLSLLIVSMDATIVNWAKGFDASAPCSPIHPVEVIGHPNKGDIWLKVNGELRQRGDLQDLIWSIPEVISFISQAVGLAPGDLIYSGTPAGVGPMQPGDEITGGVQGVAEFDFTIGPRPACGQTRSPVGGRYRSRGAGRLGGPDVRTARAIHKYWDTSALTDSHQR
jgi:hypothetical protein